MSFDIDQGCLGLSPQTSSLRECRPDYEAQAANVKKQLDSTEALESALFNFAESHNTYQFNKISSFAEMLGGVSLVKHNLTKMYEELLKRIEKEK